MTLVIQLLITIGVLLIAYAVLLTLRARRHPRITLVLASTVGMRRGGEILVAGRTYRVRRVVSATELELEERA